MPSRDVSKKKSSGPDRSALPSGLGEGEPLAAGQRIADLEAQCAHLQAELAAACARIAELETARDQVLDRIAWVVDSLHNGIEK